MSRAKSVFRVGKVAGYLRGRVWYLCYFEEGRRRRPRVGSNKDTARQLASQINAQLEVGAPAALSFEPLQLDKLRDRWLKHHEQVLRSSVQTINRYRVATEHLLRFVSNGRTCPVTSQFRVQHAEDFVEHLRTVEVTPNGHANSAKRHLLDKGIKFILEACRAMFNYAAKRRHLPPYAENPFSVLQIDRIPVENAKPIEIFSAAQEGAFLEACDDWQFPLFLTLMMTGLRPGELTHLLLPDDLDLDSRTLFVRNKPKLGWQVKTRSEREIPLVEPLAEVLRLAVGERTTGPVFLRRRFTGCTTPGLCGLPLRGLETELEHRLHARQTDDTVLSRSQRLAVARQIWRDAGAIKADRIRTEFTRLARKIHCPQWTAPKALRHLFATSLQDANVDPLIRSELMGHSNSPIHGAGHGLGMTAAYTHSRPETMRRQLEWAMQNRSCVEAGRNWLIKRGHATNSIAISAIKSIDVR